MKSRFPYSAASLGLLVFLTNCATAVKETDTPTKMSQPMSMPAASTTGRPDSTGAASTAADARTTGAASAIPATPATAVASDAASAAASAAAPGRRPSRPERALRDRSLGRAGPGKRS